MIDVGIVGVGTYLPEKTMKAAEIARLTNGVWSEDAVINKLGIKQRYLPGPDDGTQEMGAKAALKCLENTGVDPKEIDVIRYGGGVFDGHIHGRRADSQRA